MRVMSAYRVLACASTLGAAPLALGAQTIGQRVAAIGDGTVHLSFAARPDVCGSPGGGISIRREDGRMQIGNWSRSSGDEWEFDCDRGPVRVAIVVRGGAPSAIRSYVGGRWRDTAGVVDLGLVSAPEAAAYLLDVAQRAEGRAARDAILPAVLADSATVWPQLLKIARDESRPRDARRQAVFWLGQAAGDAVAEQLGAVASDGDLDRDVREAAIFALSQRPHDEGVPALIHVARTSRDPELRRKALFWLAQTNDRRAVDLFEELLLKK